MENLKAINEFPHLHRFDVDTNLTGIELPSEARFISIGSEDKKLYFVQNGGSDGGALPTHRAFIPAGNFLPVRLASGLQRAKTVFVAAKTGTGKAVIILEE